MAKGKKYIEMALFCTHLSLKRAYCANISLFEVFLAVPCLFSNKILTVKINSHVSKKVLIVTENHMYLIKPVKMFEPLRDFFA